jgi:hypothetical protein
MVAAVFELEPIGGYSLAESARFSTGGAGLMHSRGAG